MKTIFHLGSLLAALFVPCMSDIYMHVPPGSNNRINGEGENVQNANRLFDSQNNGKAGYNVGDALNSRATVNAIKENRQLPMQFYMSECGKDAKKTEVEIMWTNQHGTGQKTDDMVETQVILQYMCQDFPEQRFPDGKITSASTDFQFHTIRNGQTKTQQSFYYGYPETTYVQKTYGLHEPYYFYNTYYARERNKGLFTADQSLKNKDKAIYTRQNAAGTRRGLEVPEERDYYPYWGPTPWRDIAILVSDKKTLDLMKKYVKGPNYGYKYLCMNQQSQKGALKYINATECKAAGGRWTRFITNFLEKSEGVLDSCIDKSVPLVRGLPYESHLLSQGADRKRQYVVVQEPPEVIYAPSTVVNHNGVNMEGKFSSYKWKVPCFPTNTTQRCVLRIRYNITTDDGPREFTAKDNDKLQNNPKTKATDGKTDLQLALNTAQVARTFQDRSHVILLKSRNRLPEKYQKSNIYYIVGMGKRGNIVQTYPAMEYRFFPERITVTTDDVICFVWSGSNNNPTGRAGQGTDRTDRTNVCWVKEGCSSLKPSACSSLPLEVVDHVDKFDAEKLNLHLNTGCYTSGKVDSLLNSAPASCNPPCFRITKPGEYCYMGTRNNNFSNRRHVGQITVTGEEAKSKRDQIEQGARDSEKRKFFRFPNFSKEE